MPKGHVHEKAEEAKNRKDQEELFATIPTEHLPQIAAVFGLAEDQIPEKASREELIELIRAAKRHDIQVAKTVSVEGKDMDCPVGHMIIRVTPKNGQDWGKRSKEFFFVAMNGVACVGKRGVPVCMPEKYLTCFKDAVRKVYDQDQESLKVDYNRNGASLIVSEEYAEDFTVLFHNPDKVEAARIEQELIDGSVKFLKAKAAKIAYREAMVESFGNR